MAINTSYFNVGDRVLVAESLGWNGSQHKPGTVAQKTPSGTVTVSVDAYPPHDTVAHEVKFSASGWEWGRRAYHGRWLCQFSQQTLIDEIRAEKVRRARQYLEDHQLWRSLDDGFILEIESKVKDFLRTTTPPPTRSAAARAYLKARRIA